MKPIMIAAVSAALIASAFAAETRYVSQVGKWSPVAAEMKVPPSGFKAPTEPFEVTKDDGTTIEFTLFKAEGTGWVPSFQYKGAYDGKDYPGGPGGLTTSYKHISATSFYTETRAPNGTAYSERGFLLNNGTRMRLEGNAINDAGKQFEYVFVYDKAK